MFIRVTNNAPDRKGDPILLNVNQIMSVYEDHVPGGSLSTMIFAKNDLIWNVEESFSTVMTKINEALGK